MNEFDFEYGLLDEFEFEYNLLDEFDFEYGLADLYTDPATGQTRLFEGGFFQSDGVFTPSESWDS